MSIICRPQTSPSDLCLEVGLDLSPLAEVRPLSTSFARMEKHTGAPISLAVITSDGRPLDLFVAHLLVIPLRSWHTGRA